MHLISNSTNFNIVSIRDSGCGKNYMVIDSLKSKYMDIHPSLFDDITFDMPGYVKPEYGHIADILSWSDGKDDIAVHCTAGVSRSSAVAYLIECKRNGPDLAIRTLDERYHWPNMRIVRLGAFILKNKDVYARARKWKKEKEKAYELSELF